MGNVGKNNSGQAAAMNNEDFDLISAPNDDDDEDEDEEDASIVSSVDNDDANDDDNESIPTSTNLARNLNTASWCDFELLSMVELSAQEIQESMTLAMEIAREAALPPSPPPPPLPQQDIPQQPPPPPPAPPGQYKRKKAKNTSSSSPSSKTHSHSQTRRKENPNNMSNPNSFLLTPMEITRRMYSARMMRYIQQPQYITKSKHNHH